MVRKLSVVCASIFIFALTAGSAVAQISYCKDFLEAGNQDGSLKTFDEEWTLAQNETVAINIWVNDVPEAQLLTAGFFITYDPAMVTIESVEPYDGSEEHWDDGLTNLVPDAGGPGNYLVVVGNLACASTDNDGDIILAKVTVKSQSSANSEIMISTVPGFDTVVGCSGTNLDSQIDPNTITLNKGTGTSSTTTTGPGTTTIPTSTTSAGSSTTTTEPTSSSWQSAYAMIWGEDKEQKLSLLRFFRDEAAARNQVVRNYVSLLYRHSSEVAGVFIKHPLLCLETSELVEALIPSIESFFKTEKLVLTAGQKERVETFLNQFETKVRPELKGIIQNFRKDLRDGRLSSTVS